ncbi:MAG: anthranilate synthase component I family protein, partial [Clostridia bacterium]
PYALFSRMRESNPSPFGGYLRYPGFEIVSASPERFIQMKDRYIETKPIKGTRKRGATPEEDEFYRRELQMSEKDRSELLMIVDLERNDLNRICETGSVKVTKHFEIEAFATVFHLVTTIVGRMEEQRTYADLLRAMFPGGSITGAPKIEAMKDMDELEHSARGLYTGSIGYISFNGDCDLNIVIRTAVWQNGIYHMGIGGGITCESDPEAEYEETLQKAKAFIDIFKGEEHESNPS